jgi:hypothetical protein
MRPAAAMLVLLALAASSPDSRAQVDLHAYWDQRCKDCHGHAADFARRTLKLENGRLLGAHHRENLDVFLRNHYLNDELVKPVMAMLAAQLTTTPLFREHCVRCHGNASQFARQSLALREGVLVGLPSGRKVADTLASHGGASAADVPLLVENLRRMREEVAPLHP